MYNRRITLLLICVMGAYISNASAQRIDQTIHAGWLFYQGDVESTSEVVNPDSWERVNLPHTWNDSDASDDASGFYQGPGWYAKVLRVPASWENRQVYLHFEGANQVTEVYVNGKKAGQHIGGYTAFSFHISPFLSYDENNLVMIRVTNEIDENIPPLRADYTFYGGIYRNVRLVVTSPIHFDMENHASDGVFTEVKHVTPEKAEIFLRGKIRNSQEQKQSVRLETLIVDKDQQVVASLHSNLKLKAGELLEFNTDLMEMTNPELWSPDHPYLYKVYVTLHSKEEDILDELVLPLGIRWFEFDDQNRFVLNGKPLKLIGTNRHQDLPDKGNALTDDDHRNDFKAIKEMGFNFVRLAHYPQAKEVYRMCDELGLLVWSEIPIVVMITESEEFARNSLEMQREHIRQTRNHPSVIFYGYMNELFLRLNRESEEEKPRVAEATVELAEKLDALSKEEAPGRKTVMAAHFYEGYNEYGLADVADVLGWNLYFGWYYKDMEDLTAFLAEEHAQYPDRPLIVSEYGPGADVRNHTESPVPWDYSEEYQVIMHQSYLEQMMNIPYLAGFALWNFADFGSERRNDARPHVNQKGLMNFDRTEKAVVNLYRAWFSLKPMLHIAARNSTHRSGIADAPGEQVSTQKVTVFSNSNSVELWANGKSLGTQKVVSYMAVYDVPFRDGFNELEAKDPAGLTDNIGIDFHFYSEPLSPGQEYEIAVNVGSHFSFYDEPSKVLWMADRKYTSGLWGYQGGEPLIRTGGRQPKTGISNNILGVDNDPLFQTFNEGIEGYRFDVKDGVYEVTLCFVEPDSKTPVEEIIYNLSNETTPDIREGERIFSVDINGNFVLENLNLAAEFGALRGAEYTFQVVASDSKGIQVKFHSQEGEPVLSGIRIKQM